jgi:hypothetical protein
MILILLLWIPLCACVASFARSKGLSAGAMFFVSFLFSPLLGFIVVACSERRADVVNQRNGLVKCPACAEYIKPDANVCRYCRTAVERAAPVATTKVVKPGADAIDPTGKRVLAVVAVVMLGLVLYASIRGPQTEPATAAAPAVVQQHDAVLSGADGGPCTHDKNGKVVCVSKKDWDAGRAHLACVLRNDGTDCDKN